MKLSPWILGIVNVTPDSFSDGGRYVTLDAAIRHAEGLLLDGADILDVGGESTRPHSLPISIQEEMDRVLPVVEALHKRFDARISIDTRHFEVGREAVHRGATVINDVEGGRDPRWLTLAPNTDVSFLLMHMQGDPTNMQDDPSYPEGVVPTVARYLRDSVARFEAAGITRDRLWVDPGIGFGKTHSQCLSLLRGLEIFVGIGSRLAVGTSRKSFLFKTLGKEFLPFEERLPGGIAADLWALSRGTSVFRVHDVRSTRHAIRTWEAIDGAR